jgi:UDP-N-acetyl-D-mannosaminuronic acid dehydrogenase
MTALSELESRLQASDATLTVIGLGYVGLPVACRFAEAGFRVWGLDRDRAKVAQVAAGVCPIKGAEPGLADLVARVIAEGQLSATTDYAVCQEAQAVLIAVETPLDESRRPRYTALEAALRGIGPNLAPGALVIVESTIAPGTMSDFVRPLLEETSHLRAERDFWLVHCPERVMPGKLLANLENCARVVGGVPPEAAQAAVALYRHVVQADLDPTDCLTAELVKTTENAYRDVQIAFANEVALLCESVGADAFELRRLVNKSPYRDMHVPGAGVGGHCIPKDPWLLVAGAGPGFEPRLIPAARAVNDGMPVHVAELVEDALQDVGIPLQGAKIGVLGYAYRENSDDGRNSPTAPLVDRLRQTGAEVSIHDPFVEEYVGDWREVVAGCDAVVVMVAHSAYRELDPAELHRLLRNPVLVDGRNIFVQGQLEGFVYRGVGKPARKRQDV